MFKVQYIGTNKVFGIVQESGKTPMGSEIVKIVFEGSQHPVVMSKTAFDAFATDDPLDDTLLQELKFGIIIPRIRSLVTEYFILGYELTALFNKAGNSIADDFDRAANFALTKDDRRFVPGMSYNTFITVLEVDSIVRNIPKEESLVKKDVKGNGKSGETTPKGN